MNNDRREFLTTTGLSAAGVALSGPALSAQNQANANGANERIIVAVIGCGGMGSHHLRALLQRNDVQVAAVCDTDRTRLNTAAAAVQRANNRMPTATRDLRQVLNNDDIDAVFIATPDHWHGPAAIMAANAGKHVYVEKPCSHNIREGRLMIQAARRNNRIMQVGTQSRSTEHVRNAIRRIHNGDIGEVYSAHVWNSQRRRNIGHVRPSEPPATIDYDTWVGPAPMVPYQSNRLHYGWHWFYNFGTGDMGNDGVHDIDIGRWGLNVNTMPSTITAIGGKYAFDDDQEFADTQTVIFEYPGNGEVGQRKQLIFEQRIWSPYTQSGYENGDVFYGTRGYLLLGKNGGWKLFQGNRLVHEERGNVSVTAHHDNFFECIRNNRRPNADIEINHYSTALCHLGNIATRIGRTLRFNPETEQILEDREANDLVRRQYRQGHWAVPRGV